MPYDGQRVAGSAHSGHPLPPGNTLVDLGLGVLGSMTAALVIHHLWQRGQLREAAPQLADRHLV